MSASSLEGAWKDRGSEISVCSGEVVAAAGTEEKRVAVMLATIIAVEATEA